MLQKNGDKVFVMENRKYFCDKFNHFQVKRKKIRTSLLARLIFFAINAYLAWDVIQSRERKN